MWVGPVPFFVTLRAGIAPFQATSLRHMVSALVIVMYTGTFLFPKNRVWHDR